MTQGVMGRDRTNRSTIILNRQISRTKHPWDSANVLINSYAASITKRDEFETMKIRGLLVDHTKQ